MRSTDESTSSQYLLRALMTTTSKKKKWNLLENCCIVCPQIVLKCLHLARVGRPDIQYAGNKIERSITKWTKAYDTQLSRLFYGIHHTCKYKQFYHLRNNIKQLTMGLLPRLRFCRRSWVFELHFWWNIVHFGKSYVCSNQLDVETNFSSTKLVLSYVDVKWRMDGIPRSWFVRSDRYSSSQTHASERSRTERFDQFQEKSWKDWL